MVPRSFATEGIVLARRAYSEADRILSIYTKDYGRLSFLAKGVRKLPSRKRGHIEVFSRLKLQAVRAKGIDILAEAELIDNFGEIRKNLKKVALAYYFMEVIGRTTHEGEKNSELYEYILKSLQRLKTERKLKKLRLNFILELLIILGFWPKGRSLPNPDTFIEEVTERGLSSVRVGKKLVA